MIFDYLYTDTIGCVRHINKVINSAGCGFKFTKLICCKHDLHVYMH